MRPLPIPVEEDPAAMVTVELRSQPAESDHVEWETIAVLHVDGQRVDVSGDADRLDRSLPVISLTTGRRLRFEDDREDWARSLPTLYHAPDFMAVVVEDSDPPSAPDVEREDVALDETSHHPAAR
jgi:hypothetical protein